MSTPPPLGYPFGVSLSTTWKDYPYLFATGWFSTMILCMCLPADGLIIITRAARPFVHNSFPRPLTRKNFLKFYLGCVTQKTYRGN